MEQATGRLLAAISNCLASVDANDDRWTPTELVAVGTAASWLAMAHHAISGQLP